MSVPSKEQPFPLLSIEISVPTTRPRHGGIHSNISASAVRIYVRCNGHEKQLVMKACSILGIHPASFFRDAGVNAAGKIVEHYDAYIRRDGSG